MRIGITGATGFIGTALAQAAGSHGHQIVVFSRKTNLNLPWASEVRSFKPEADQPLDASGLDALVHLAGESIMGYWTADKKRRIRESRVPVTERIAECLKTATSPPKIFLCGSASGAYGDRGDERLSEKSPFGSGFLAEVCQGWESAAAIVAEKGTRVVNLRTGMVLGKDGGAWPLLRKVFTFCLGSKLGTGQQWVPWIHLEDEVGLILHALEHDSCVGPINLASPNPVTNQEMTRLMAQAMHRPVMPPVPAFALKLVLGELSAVVLESQRVQPAVALETGYTFKHPTLEAALSALV
jgi:uncharacterized protein